MAMVRFAPVACWCGHDLCTRGQCGEGQQRSHARRGGAAWSSGCWSTAARREASIVRKKEASFSLAVCSFHSAAQVGCMSSLTNLELRSVHVTMEEQYIYGFLCFEEDLSFQLQGYYLLKDT
jgi:hypothetical protein